MNAHEDCIRLAAAAIDFPLTPDERRRLELHLDACGACQRTATAMRGQAAALRATRVIPLSDRRADELLASVLAPPAVRVTARLLLVAGLLALLALASIAAGAGLLQRSDDLAVVPPAPSPSLDVAPTASPRTADVLGAAWTAASFPTSADAPVGTIEAVTASGPGFVAVGHGCRTAAGVGLVGCEALVWTSPDGRSWSRVPSSDALDIGTYLPLSGPSIGMYDVAAGPPGIVAIGYAGRLATTGLSEFDSAVWFSRDGATWERLASPLGTAGHAALRPAAIAWSGDRFVIVGEDRASLSGAGADLQTARAAAAVWTSPDGRAWSRVQDGAVFDVGGFLDTMEDPSSGGMRDITTGPGGLVAVGDVCDAAAPGEAAHCSPAVWTSADGASWSRANVPAGVEGWLGSIAATRTGYVAAGSEICAAGAGTGASACPTLVMTSADGRTWLRRSFPQDRYLRGLTRLGDRLFAIAPEGPTSLWTTADGSAWSPYVDAGGPSSGSLPGGLVSYSHMAATASVAVMVGTGPTGESVEAWYSEAPGP